MAAALAPAFRRTMHYARRRGVLRALAKVVRTGLVGRQHWYVTCGDLLPWLEARPRDPDLVVRLARPEDVPELEGLGRQHVATLRAWLRPGYFLFVAERAGRLVAYRCLSTRPHPWVAPFFRMRPDQIYGLDLFTDPAWRRRGISYELMAASNPVLVARGYRQVLSIQRVDNVESIAMTEARAILRLGTLTRTCLLGWVRFTFEPAPDLVVAAPGPRLRTS